MYDDEFSISPKKVLKWLIGLIVAAIIIIPIVFIFYLNIQTPEFTYEYTNTNNLISKVSKDLEFNTERKGVSLRFSSDIINSYIEDQVKDLDLELPKKVEIQQIYIDMESGKVFLNAKAYGFKVPLSASISLNQTTSQAIASLSSFMLADIPINQEIVEKYVGEDNLSYTMSLKEIDVIPYFEINTISWKPSGINLFYQVDYAALYDMFRKHPDEIAREIAKYVEHNQKLSPMLELASYLSNSEKLTLNEIKYYMDMMLSNQDVADTLIEMVKKGQL